MSPSRRRRGRGGKPSAQQLRDFWGEDVDDPVDDEPARVITPGVDPTAMIESLGPLPFPGAGGAPHYFQVVYDRAAGLAVALAAAAGLLSGDGEPVDGTDDAELLPANGPANNPSKSPANGSEMAQT